MPSPPGEKSSNGRQPPRVVILGGGYGGVHAALRLQKAARHVQNIHGHLPGHYRLLVGSVTDRVIRSCEVPVLVVPCF